MSAGTRDRDTCMLCRLSWHRLDMGRLQHPSMSTLTVRDRNQVEGFCGPGHVIMSWSSCSSDCRMWTPNWVNGNVTEPSLSHMYLRSTDHHTIHLVVLMRTSPCHGRNVIIVIRRSCYDLRLEGRHEYKAPFKTSLEYARAWASAVYERFCSLRGTFGVAKKAVSLTLRFQHEVQSVWTNL